MAKRTDGIAVADTNALNEHISAIRGAATSWTYTVADVQRLAMEAEARLSKLFLAPTHRRGAVATARSAGPSAAAYRYSVSGADVTLRRAKDGWRLVNYQRCDVYPRSIEKIDIRISQDQAEKSVETMRRQNRVTVVTPTEKAA
ncbi:hypothetical protein [Tardiphaga sp. 841_E9_N1_2]|uniref:hypothetical protein n=1 Tax=Tardiphaga sp. 841_E9_N1_2 TaxID=3240762 RepID=UPI003F29F5F1